MRLQASLHNRRIRFLEPALTSIQFQNMTMIATALVMGTKFNLSEIRRMWLKDKSVSALSEFFSMGKFSTDEMQTLHLLQMRDLHRVKGDYLLIDDTMKHHTKFRDCGSCRAKIRNLKIKMDRLEDSMRRLRQHMDNLEDRMDRQE